MKLLFERQLSAGWFRAFDERPAGQLASVHQIHSSLVLPVTTPQLAEQKADGIVSDSSAILAIKTADCLPVVMIGQHGVGLLHAGWRGLADGILLTQAVKALIPREAFIGPCIGPCCFEVTAEFAAHFPQTALIKKADGTLRFDLLQEARRQLFHAFPGIQVSDSGECTCCVDKYPSFRRDKTQQRIWNLFIPLAQ